MLELFSAFGIDWKLLIAQSVNFLIVLGGLTFFLYKPVNRMLAEREHVIAKGLEDAEAAGKAREEIESEREGIITRAHKEGEGIVERAGEEGKRERAEIIGQAQHRAESMVKEATLEGQARKSELLKEADREIAQTAVLAAEKLLREKTS